MQNLVESHGLVATIDPTGAGTGTSTSDPVDMAHFESVLFTLAVGTIVATGTVDMDIQEGTNSTTFNTATALESITQLTDADSNKQVEVEVRGIALTPGYTWLRAVAVRGTANSAIAVIAQGCKADYGPASDYNLATVDETITV